LRLPRHRAPAHGGSRLRVRHDRLHAPRELARLDHPVGAGGGAHADAPPGDEPRVRVLVRPLRHRHHRRAARHGLQRRVPPAVRHEAPDGAVRQHAHLVAPLHHHAAAVAVAVAVVPVVAAHHPQVRPRGGGEASPELLLLPPAHHRHAPERHVHHRPRRLRVEPLHVALLVVPVQVVRRSGGGGCAAAVERGGGRADG
ncbi:Os02g0203200, partial [Oryza sativa Japonica Group]